MNDIHLTLTLDETNLILEGLGEMSYKRVYQLIVKIQQQAEMQLQEADGQRESQMSETDMQTPKE
ncbi:MAG TPA: hypothetical protein VGD99_22215 [Anaerolineae bacterium]|jgi:hypothetical protein